MKMPNNYINVAMWTAVVIVICIAVGLIYGGDPTP